METVSEDFFRCKGSKGPKREGDKQVVVPCLCIALQDSSLHRLVLHATAQFYSMRSLSEGAGAGAGAGAGTGAGTAGRVTRVALPRAMSAKKNPMLVKKISLAAYLHAVAIADKRREE